MIEPARLPEGPARPPGATDPLGTQTRWRVTVIAIAALVVLIAGLVTSRLSEEPLAAYVELDGSVTMPDAVLTGTDGGAFDLRAETDGHVTLVFFGYLSCPDACPIQMAVLGRAFGDLAPDVRDQLRVVFITTDPARDSPSALRAFLDRFDPSFIGLTGPTDVLRDVQLAAGLPAATLGATDADGNYVVGHASQVLVFDGGGVARRAYPLGVRQADWVRDLNRLDATTGAVP